VNQAQRTAFDDAMCAYVDVYDLEKPLMIVSEGKTTLGYETCVMMAQRSNLQVELAMLRCEDGKLHEHAFISARKPGLSDNMARAALDLVFRAKEGKISRQNLQYYLGLMLGYAHDDVLVFLASAIARNCPCDCCGGPFVSEHEFDS